MKKTLLSLGAVLMSSQILIAGSYKIGSMYFHEDGSYTMPSKQNTAYNDEGIKKVSLIDSIDFSKKPNANDNTDMAMLTNKD